MEEDYSFSLSSDAQIVDDNHGWQKVTYPKKQRKNQPNKISDSAKANGSVQLGENSGAFKGLEKHAEERRKILDAQRATAIYDSDNETNVRSKKKKNWGDEEEDDDFSSDAKENNAPVVNKKEKVKKVKKPKVTVAEAAGKIDADDLAAFLAEISGSYEGQQDIQLMRFADYFGRAFSTVSSSQFPWLKLFRESTVEKIADVPISYISETVYKTSVDWINQRSYQALGTFVLWSLDSIMADLASQQPGPKGSKKGAQPSSKSQVAMFTALAMVLRRKPDVLINLIPRLKESPMYQGQDKLQVIVWMVVQASYADLAVGLYVWAHYVLPVLSGKSGSTPLNRDLVLQLIERILASPKARSILVNNAVRKGERLIPPTSLDLLLHVTFPAQAARVKATERFEAVYSILREVALSSSPGSKGMKQLSQQILPLAVKTAGEGVAPLSQEATSIFVWCLTQNIDCYKQWDKIYADNLEASVAALKKLSDEWKELSPKQQPHLQAIGQTLKSFRQKNEKALSGDLDSTTQVLFKEADKHCKTLLGKVSSGHGCVKTVVFTLVVLAAGVTAMSSTQEGGWDMNKLSMFFNDKLVLLSEIVHN